MLSLSSSLHPLLSPPSLLPTLVFPLCTVCFPSSSSFPSSSLSHTNMGIRTSRGKTSAVSLLCLLMELREMRFEFPLTLCSICASLEPKKGPGLHNIIYCDAHLSNLKAFFKKYKINDHLAFFFLPLLLVHPIVFSVHLEAISCFYTG